MDKTALVGLDLEKGSRIVQILDDTGLKVTVALWAFLADYGDWRLILSSRKFDAAGPTAAYGLFHDALDAAGTSLEETPTVGIFHTTDPLIRALRKEYRNARSGRSLGPFLVGNRFVEDGYIYRIS
jgi:hypothetical protein